MYYMNPYSAELCHHGILGMKWGVRRYQNADGSLTAAGEKRYNTGDTKKQTRTEKLTEQFMKKGMSMEDASRKAYYRNIMEKALIVAGGVTLTVAAAKIAKNHYDSTVDKILDSGVTLQTVGNDPKKNVEDTMAFYTSYKNSDKTKYKGIYGAALLKANPGKEVKSAQIGIKDKLKVASRKSAKGVLEDLSKSDKDFTKQLADHLSDSKDKVGTISQRAVMIKGAHDAKKGKINDSVYKALNVSLTNHTTKTADEVAGKYYKALKEKGYDAIQDLNDVKYSGYRSSDPLIVINKTGKTYVKDVQNLKMTDVGKNYVKGYANVVMKSYVPGVVATGTAYSTMNSRIKRDDARVQKYRDEHPNSKMTYQEILKSLKE